MRNPVVALFLGLTWALAFAGLALAQEVTDIAPGPGWKPAPRRHSKEARAKDRVQYIEGKKNDPHNLTGVWGEAGIPLNTKAAPPYTPYGEQLAAQTQADISPAGIPIDGSKDPQEICDPMGFPRLFAFNYGFEFIQLPDRMLEFFEWGHTWRTIWTDGRKLPPNPPQDRFMGYAVGHWEADTFVVESSGFDDRSWINRDERNGHQRGFVHTDEMRIVERYRRLSYDLLDATLTITDPKVYTAPWVSSGRAFLFPGTELSEYFCVPSEEKDFQNLVSRPAAGADPIK